MHVKEISCVADARKGKVLWGERTSETDGRADYALYRRKEKVNSVSYSDDSSLSLKFDYDTETDLPTSSFFPPPFTTL